MFIKKFNILRYLLLTVYFILYRLSIQSAKR
nr:MAG TPA: hypothetical protein [Caudoviricetes sp.]